MPEMRFHLKLIVSSTKNLAYRVNMYKQTLTTTLILTAAIFQLPQEAMAQEEASKGSDLADGRITTNKSDTLPNGVVADSSAHKRIKYKTTLRIGTGIMLGTGLTLAGSYNKSHEMTFEWAFDRARINVLDLYKSERLRFGALAHYFTSNSFHLSGGLVYEKSTDSIFESLASRDVEQIEFQLGLGNRWNLGRFVIGSEWVGFSNPLFKISEKHNPAFGNSNDNLVSEDIMGNGFALMSRVRLLNSYIGFSF